MKNAIMLGERNRKKAQVMMRAVNTVILGKELLIWRVMSALLAGGHILLEDMPDVGKTTTANDHSLNP